MKQIIMNIIYLSFKRQLKQLNRAT